MHRDELELKAESGSMNGGNYLKDIETKAEMLLNCSPHIHGHVDLAFKGALGFGRRKYKSGS